MRTRYVLASLASCYAALGQPECTAEENGRYYDLTSLRSKSDYVVKSPIMRDRDFRLNVCSAVNSEIWGLPDPTTIGGVYRDKGSDVSIGLVNTTLQIRNSNPLLLLSGGSPCGSEGSNVHAATTIRFICDNDVFGTGKPEFLAQLPPDDDTACGFVFEWRTHIACPTARAGGASSVIAIMAAIALIILLTYIVVGVLYRRFILGHRGFDQFPRISLVPLSAMPRSLDDILDWFRDIRDHLRGGARDLWPRSSANSGSHSSGWAHRRNGFSPLAREEEQAMFRDGPDGPDTRFSLEDDADLGTAQELVDSTPPVPPKDPDNHERPI